MQFHVIGTTMQAVVVQLEPNEEVRAEAGAMRYMTAAVQMNTQMQGGLMGGLRRMLAGESLFLPVFKSMGAQQYVAFAVPIPGKVQQLNMNMETWLCQKDSYLFSTMGIENSIAVTKRMGVGFFGGEGFILQKLSGAGTAFIQGGGEFLEFNLRPGETIKVDTGCIVAFQESVDYDIQFVGGFKNTLFGGEGLFLATLTGPGRAILQTLPFSRLAGRIIGLPTEGSGSLGGVAGTFGDLGRSIFGGND